jgi:putative ABC transport system ATP-binding protein
VSTLPILAVQQLGRTYATADGTIAVLQDVSFAIHHGETCAITGPSGSGKSTLLALCAGLDLPTTGSVTFDGRDLSALDEDARAHLRSQDIGFVFQNFQLLPTLTALENVMVPLELKSGKADPQLARDLLARVGLEHRRHHFPIQLSGGEQQRVALARAFIHRPRLLFADEPTGNLDAEARALIEDILFTLNRETQTTLIIVTHDASLAAKTARELQLSNGRLVADHRHVS